jgi:hypothetical protein
MRTIDQLIKEAKDALEKAEAGSMEHAAATGKVEALTNLKQRGFGFTQDDLNQINRQAKEDEAKRWQEVFEMNLEEAKAAKEALGGTLAGTEGGGDSGGGEGDGANVFGQVQSALEQRDQKIQAAEERLTGLSHSLYSERVENNLRRALGELEVGTGDEKAKVSLKGDRFDFVRGIAGEQELIEKLMKGETLPDDVYQQRAKSVYEGLPEVFETEDSELTSVAGEVIVLGHKVKDGGPGIPATPSSGQTAEITDEDRRQRAASVY